MEVRGGPIEKQKGREEESRRVHAIPPFEKVANPRKADTGS